MAKLKGVHASKKSQATAYKALVKAGKNKLIKLQRHLKHSPNDAQAKEAVKGAREHTGRTEPKRSGARLNPCINDHDKIALAEIMIREKQASKDELGFQNRSLNLLNGRISALGKRMQGHIKLSRAVRNEAQFDRKGKVFPKPKMTRAERDLAKARALGKAAADSGVSKAKQKKVSKQPRKAA